MAKFPTYRPLSESMRNSRYQRVVIDGESPGVVAKDYRIAGPAITLSVRSEFKRRHPSAWERLERLRQGRPPYLWMMRLYEQHRMIAKEDLGEGWSNRTMVELLKYLGRIPLDQQTDQKIVNLRRYSRNHLEYLQEQSAT